MTAVTVPVFYYKRHVADALVDEEDAEHVLRGRWTFEPYGHACRWSPNGPLLMHRELLDLVRGDGKIAHHKNGDGLDNRRTNLRVCGSAKEHGMLRHEPVPTAPEAPHMASHKALYFVRRPVVAGIAQILGVPPYYAVERIGRGVEA